MNNCAVICEYNPFHDGHKYQLDRIRNHAIDNVFCVMSGSFVQSAMPAFCDKSIRAKCAVMGGANAVIELPTLYSSASAQYFAEGALKIISGIKNIKYLAMGATAEADILMRLAQIKTAHKDEFHDAVIKSMKAGNGYTTANHEALIKMYADIYSDKSNITEILSDPNNILCIEYICAIEKFAPNIEPLIIERKGAQYNSVETEGEYISATAIRCAVENNKLECVSKHIPYKLNEMMSWRKDHAPDIEFLKKSSMYAIKCSSANYLSQLRNCSEGMEFLFKNNSYLCNYDVFTDIICGKRYSKKRIYRFMLDALLGIKKEYLNYRFSTRLLAVDKGFDFNLLPNCVKTNNNDIKSAAKKDKEVNCILNIEEKATALYNTLCSLDGGYYNYSVIKI